MTMSVMATMTSNIATSTRCGPPVASLSRSAAKVPIAAKRALEISPTAPMGATAGGLPSSRFNSYIPLIASTIAASAGHDP